MRADCKSDLTELYYFYACDVCAAVYYTLKYVNMQYCTGTSSFNRRFMPL